MQRERLELIRQDLATALEGSLDSLHALRGGCLLVTGGTGFIGTWLAELASYLNDDHSFDLRLILLARNTNIFAEATPHLANRPQIRLFQSDVRNLRDIPSEVNWIIHAGATPDNRVHNSDPLRTIETILGGTKAILEGAIRLPNLEGLLNLSSGLVYGPQPSCLERIAEDDFHGFDSSAFGSVYAEAKRMAEALCFAYANQHRIRVTNARPFAFIGPYQHLDRPWAINNFIRDGLHGGPIRILGDGETVRSYMYPADMAVWLLAILATGHAGVSYNVGSPDRVTLQAAAELVAGQLAARPKITVSAASAHHTGHSHFVPDVTRAGKSLGLQLHFDLATTVRRTLQWNSL